MAGKAHQDFGKTENERCKGIIRFCPPSISRRGRSIPLPGDFRRGLRAEAEIASAGEAFNAPSRAFDEFLLPYGIDPDTIEERLPSQKNRIWQKDSELATVSKESINIETALQENLEQLLDLFPPSWGRRAIAPAFLLEHLSADPDVEDRFAYGLHRAESKMPAMHLIRCTQASTTAMSRRTYIYSDAIIALILTRNAVILTAYRKVYPLIWTIFP